MDVRDEECGVVGCWDFQGVESKHLRMIGRQRINTLHQGLHIEGSGQFQGFIPIHSVLWHPNLVQNLHIDELLRQSSNLDPIKFIQHSPLIVDLLDQIHQCPDGDLVLLYLLCIILHTVRVGIPIEHFLDYLQADLKLNLREGVGWVCVVPSLGEIEFPIVKDGVQETDGVGEGFAAVRLVLHDVEIVE